MNAQQQQVATETGINVSNYIAEREAGTISISKPVKASGNYVLMRATFGLEYTPQGPKTVEGAPELKNINRDSLAAIRKVLAEQRDALDHMDAQVTAMEADMDKLDAAP